MLRKSFPHDKAELFLSALCVLEASLVMNGKGLSQDLGTTAESAEFLRPTSQAPSLGSQQAVHQWQDESYRRTTQFPSFSLACKILKEHNICMRK